MNSAYGASSVVGAFGPVRNPRATEYRQVVLLLDRLQPSLPASAMGPWGYLHRRFHPPAGCLLRGCRIETNLWAC